MGSNSKSKSNSKSNTISKRRPRQNIISMILKNAKNNGNNGTTKPSSSTGSGSATSSSSQSESGGGGGRSSRGRSSSRSRSGGGASANNTTPNVYGYHGPKKGILQSAVELTRRSKRAAAATSSKIRSRSKSTRRRSKSRSSLRRGLKKDKKKIVFQKGQRAFYRSSKGISKVTIVGIHHDSKLEPYYTIRLKDGKEKQMDGKHLTPVQQAQPQTEEESEKEASNNNEKGGGATATAADGGGHEDAVGNSSMTEPTSDSEDENEVIDYTSDGDDDEEDDKYNEQDQQQQQQQQQQDDDTNGHYQGSHSSMNDDEGDNNSDNNSQHHHEQVNHKKFTPGQDAYYRSPNGSIIKIQVLEQQQQQQQPSSLPHYYTISHPDGTDETKNVKSSSLATLMDLTSKELSMLMKERNNKRATESSSAGTGANSSVSDGKSIRSGKSQGGKSRSGSRGRTARGRHCRRPSTSRDQVECGEQGAAIAIVDAEDHEGYEAEGGELPTLMIGLEKSLSFPGTEVSSKDTEDELGDSSSPSTSELPVLPSAEEDNNDDAGVDAPSNSKVPDLPALICPYKMTKAKTEDGGTKMVRLYSAETKVYYKNAAGVQYATILGVHLDDLLDPFYSVRLEDGREKQTDNAHISLEDPRKNKEEDDADADAAEGGDEDEGDDEKEEQVEVVGDGEQDEPSSEDKEEEEEEQVAEENTFAEPVSRDPEESEAEVTTEPAVARQHRRHSLRRPSTDASSHRRPSVDDIKAPNRSKSFHSVDSTAQQRRNEAAALRSSRKSFHSVDSKGQQRRDGAAARNEAAALRASLANMVEEQLNNAADDGDSKKHQSEAAASAKKNHRDATMYSTTSTHEPAAAAALVMPAIFALGDEVLYTSSQGEQARAVVKRLNRDKKNRPYYVVRLPKGKEKQVYGHRLRPYEPPGTVGSRRSRSSSRASTRNPSRTRGRSVSSKVSTKTSGTSTASHARRLSVDSNDSRGNLSNSSRRSTSSRERHATRERARQDPSGHRRGRDERSVESSSSRGISVASSYTQHTSSNGRRTRSPSATPSEVSKRSTERGTERKSRRERSLSMMRRSKSSVSEAAGRESRRHGRERSHSRAPSDEPTYHKTSTRGRVTSRVPGVSTRSKVMSADTSSKASDEHGSKSENRTRSLSKLRSFRKSFVGMKKKQQK